MLKIIKIIGTIAVAAILWLNYALTATEPPSGGTGQALEQHYSSKEITVLNTKFNRAKTLAQQGKIDAAIKQYQVLIRQAPRLTEAYNNLAILQARRGEFKNAIATLESSIEKHGTITTVYKNIRLIYAELASQAYRKALNEESDPNQFELVRLDSLTLPQAPGDVAVTVAVAEKSDDKKDDTTILLAAQSTDKPEQTPQPEISEQQPQEPQNVPEGEALATIEIIPEPAPKPDTDKQIQTAIVDTIQSWGKAWSDQDLDGYISHYAPNFAPRNGMALADWKKQRRGRLKWRDFIIVKLSNIKVTVENDTAFATFSQHYKSNIFEDIISKTLQLLKINDQWQITRETASS